MEIIASREFRWSPFFAACALLVAGVGQTQAQASATATRGVSISVFGGGSFMEPDYTQDTGYGLQLGGDVTLHRGSLGFSIEPKYGRTSGPLVTETYFLGNVEVDKALGASRRFHPFIAGGIGYGHLNVGHPYLVSNDSTAYDFTGGLDTYITSNFAVRVDGQYQLWHGNAYPNGLTPHGLDVGFLYRLHGVRTPFRH